jgi:hypothetical protein
MYPSIRNAVFSAIVKHFDYDERDVRDNEAATDLTNHIMQAIALVDRPRTVTNG